VVNIRRGMLMVGHQVPSRHTEGRPLGWPNPVYRWFI
jgi:hypothetical protein